jgi:hypothetical protein
LKERKLHALTDSIDISTITIENMPGGTPWGQIVEAATRVSVFILSVKLAKIN